MNAIEFEKVQQNRDWLPSAVKISPEKRKPRVPVPVLLDELRTE